MEGFYDFSTIVRNKESSFELNPKILSLLTWNGHVFKTPENLKYFIEPHSSAYPLDLTSPNHINMHTWEKINDCTKIEKFLLEKHVRDEISELPTNKIKIWTQRSVLSRIMQGKSYLWPWTLQVSKIGNNICLISKSDDIENSDFSAQHWKFAQYCFSDSVGSEPDTSVPIDENIKSYGFFHTQLDKYELFYSAEITGVIASTDVKDLTDISELNKLRFVLTKTMFNIRNTSKVVQMYFRWWAQACWVKVNDIYAATKTVDHNERICVNQKVQRFSLQDLIQRGHWKPNETLEPVIMFLSNLQDKLDHVTCPYTTCELHYDDNTREVSYQMHEGKTSKSFLSEELIAYLKCN